jgi:hypothetical protein
MILSTAKSSSSGVSKKVAHCLDLSLLHPPKQSKKNRAKFSKLATRRVNGGFGLRRRRFTLIL